MGIRDIVDWPEPYTISRKARELKRRFVQSYTDEGDDEKVREMHYIVAVSSGKAVTEEIPKQIGRRAGWASQQGANFVELLIENPAQLVMDENMLVNLSRQLNLHYNIHSSTSMAYGMSYRRGRGNGFDPAHEYTIKLLKAVKNFGKKMRDRGEGEDQNGYPRLYAINGHMAVAQVPAEEERLAQDVSVDPFGHPMEESKIFDVKEARLGIWKQFIWDEQGVESDVQEFASILGNIDEVNDAQDYIRRNLIDILEKEGYVTDDLLQFVNDIKDQEALVSLLFNVPSLQLRDLPATIEGLKNHTNGTQLAQYMATSDPVQAYQELPPSAPRDRASQERVDEALNSLNISLPDSRGLNLATEDWDDIREDAQSAILHKEPKDGIGGNAFRDVTNFFEKDGKEAAEAMRNMARTRRLYRDEFNKESSIFRYIIPLWMPFADEHPDDPQPQVKQIWGNITGKSFDSHEEAIDWIYGSHNAMNEPRDEEDVLAAATGAYVWGHFTQIPPGYDQDGSLLQMLDDADVYWSFESHMAGPAENARIWKPKDMIEVVKAINETPVPVVEEGEVTEEKETFDRTRITIDMEHIASQKVDPMWVVDPTEEVQEKENYKGLDDGDGKYILINHVTHPYITEDGHQHGPVRRGDTRVYRYIHTLVDKGMTSDENLPSVVMYEIGSEKDETLFMLRLILNMIEHGIEPDELVGDSAAEIINKEEPDGLKEYLIQKFFGVTDTEVQHEWQEIHQHALDPLDDLLETAKGSHTWMGQAATERGTRPEEWEGEEYR